MADNPDLNLFFVVVLSAIAAMVAVWFFVLVPIERRNYERKLAILRQKMKKHEGQLGESGNVAEDSKIGVDSGDGT